MKGMTGTLEVYRLSFSFSPVESIYCTGRAFQTSSAFDKTAAPSRDKARVGRDAYVTDTQPLISLEDTLHSVLRVSMPH
jgi:hypothetical protein